MKWILPCMFIMICLSHKCFSESDRDKSAEHGVTPAAGAGFQSIHGQRAHNDARFFISQALKNELKAQEDAAFQAYIQKSAEIGAWALEELLRSYARNGLIMRDINSGWEQEIKSHVMFAHARLYKLYTSMKDDQSAQKHLEEVERISDGLGADAIMKLVDRLDEKQGRESGSDHDRP